MKAMVNPLLHRRSSVYEDTFLPLPSDHAATIAANENPPKWNILRTVPKLRLIESLKNRLRFFEEFRGDETWVVAFVRLTAPLKQTNIKLVVN